MVKWLDWSIRFAKVLRLGLGDDVRSDFAYRAGDDERGVLDETVGVGDLERYGCFVGGGVCRRVASDGLVSLRRRDGLKR